jgi:hypothetical protein
VALPAPPLGLDDGLLVLAEPHAAGALGIAQQLLTALGAFGLALLGEIRKAAMSRRHMLQKLRARELLDKREHRREEVAVLVDAAQHVGRLEGQVLGALGVAHLVQVTGADTVGRGNARSEYALIVVLLMSFWPQSTSTLPVARGLRLARDDELGSSRARSSATVLENAFVSANVTSPGVERDVDLHALRA